MNKPPKDDFDAAAYEEEIETPLLDEAIRQARAEQRRKANGHAGPLVRAIPYLWVDPATIPPRQFLYGQDLIRGFVSMVVAPGGLGKTSYSIVEALAMVSGRPLLGKKVPECLRVWLWNLEDPLEELTRRIQAACQYYHLAPDDLGDRLHVNGRETPLCITTTSARSTIIDSAKVMALMSEISDRGIDVMKVDPFVSSHRMPENDNSGIDLVAKTWGSVAGETQISISLTHHTRKQGSVEIDAESSRGAKALIEASRSVRVMNRMTPQEAITAGVDNHRSFFRVIRDKANLTPSPDKSDWYHLVDVPLANGDHVGVVTPWVWPDAFEGVKVEHLIQVQQAVRDHRYRRDSQAKDWVGHAVGRVLGIDTRKPNKASDDAKTMKALKANRAKVSSLLATWVHEGVLGEIKGPDENRIERIFTEVGKWVGDDNE
jgi:hypothetical protein